MQDSVFGKPYADRLKELLPHAEGPLAIEGADHFMQDDRGPEIAAAIVDFLDRTVGAPAPREQSPRRAPRRRGTPAGGSPLARRRRRVRRDARRSAARRAGARRASRGRRGARARARDARRPQYWRSAHGHLYALELGDLGRGRPSTATVYGLWERWEPRPPESEIDGDLLDFCLWFAELAPGIDTIDVARVAERASIPPH